MNSVRIGRYIVFGVALFLGAGVGLAKDYVVDPGACVVNKGDDEGEGDGSAYCTIQEAIDAAFANGGGEVKIFPGLYAENLTLREDVELRGEGNRDAIIVRYVDDGVTPPILVRMANDSGIQDLTLEVPTGTDVPVTLVSIANVEDVEIEDIVIDGGLNRNTTGVFVQNLFLETSRIRKSTLQRLEVGILAEDTRFQITRCFFEDLLRDGIYVRPPTAKGDDESEVPEVGDEDDLEFSGFNRFRNIGSFEDDGGSPINPGDAFLLRNTTGRALLAQLNDWGIYNSAGIENRLSLLPPGSKAVSPSGADAAVIEPFLGKSLFPGSVWTRIENIDTGAALLNANPVLRLGGIDTGIQPAFDSASKLYSFTFLNPDTYDVLAQAPGFLSASRTAVVAPGDVVAMEIGLTPDGSTEGEVPPEIHSTDQNGDNQVNFSELLRVIQFYNATELHCAPGTEDNYAPGPGDRNCSHHAADYAPRDWQLNLSETLRVVQFYNAGGYTLCPDAGTEDGYCPGT
jgi:hypothetical protein